MTVRASALAAQALREYLLLSLPAQVAVVNLTRAATLTTPAAGPWTIPAAASLGISLTGAAAFTVCTLTAGSRSASQLATEINSGFGSVIATALTDGRLRLTSTTTPTGPDTVSVVALDADATGAALVLGFDPGGECIVRAPLVAPTSKGLCDGEPLVLEPLAQGRMIVVIRDREDVAVQAELRREERLATMELLVYVPMTRQGWHQSREEIQAACECIIDVISSTSGRQLARSAENDVGFVQVKSVKVSGTSWETKKQNFLLDIAKLVVTARVFQRPTL
jgi:hypothetical protein